MSRLFRTRGDDRLAKIYADAILSSLTDEVRKKVMSVLEERKIEYTSEFALKYIGMGETEGEKRGKKEGHVEATKKHLLRLLETKSLLTSDAQDRIDAESRDTVLEAWFERALTAETLDAVFGPSEPE